MTTLINNPRERTRFLRFAVVGIIGAVVDFGVMNLLVNVLHSRLIVGGTISFVAAILSNFIWNRYWTYPDSRSKPLLRQLVQFAIVNVMGLGIRLPTLAFLEPVMNHLATLVIPYLQRWIPSLTPKFIGSNVTLAIAVLIVMFWNFFVNRYWTYNDVQ